MKRINIWQVMQLVLALFAIWGSADLDGDGKIEPNEARAAITRSLPPVIQQFPNLFPAGSRIAQPGAKEQFAEELIGIFDRYCD